MAWNSHACLLGSVFRPDNQLHSCFRQWRRRARQAPESAGERALSDPGPDVLLPVRSLLLRSHPAHQALHLANADSNRTKPKGVYLLSVGNDGPFLRSQHRRHVLHYLPMHSRFLRLEYWPGRLLPPRGLARRRVLRLYSSEHTYRLGVSSTGAERTRQALDSLRPQHVFATVGAID